MSSKTDLRLGRVLLRWVGVVPLVCAAGTILLALHIELNLKRVCGLATQKYPGNKVEALMELVESGQYSYSDRQYEANNRALWALGQLGDKRALPFLKSLFTGEPCDHETNLCQGEIKEAIRKLEGNQFNLPAFLWRRVLNY